jgi:hypothetical protein
MSHFSQLRHKQAPFYSHSEHNVIFGVTTACGLASGFQHFGRNIPPFFRTEVWEIMLFSNIGIYLDNTLSRSESKPKFYYDRRPVGQSVLVSGHHLGSAIILLSLLRIISTDICGNFIMGCLFWGEDGSVQELWTTSLYKLRTSTTGPCQLSHSRVQVPQYLRPYLTVSFKTGLLTVAGPPLWSSTQSFWLLT